MPDHQNSDWWKLCDHPVVQGLSRLAGALFVAITVPLLVWVASTFDGMRTELLLLEQRLGYVLPAVQSVQRDHEIRIRGLEADRRQNQPTTPKRN
jgi:hypothetical protein